MTDEKMMEIIKWSACSELPIRTKGAIITAIAKFAEELEPYYDDYMKELSFNMILKPRRLDE